MSESSSIAALPTDADLIAASQKGDHSAFGRLVERYQTMVTSLIYAHCGHLQQSEDVAQDTFISAWKSLPALRNPLTLPAWLCQIARRRMADSLRKNSSREIAFSQIPDFPPAAAEATVLSSGDAEFLWRTLAGIPQPYRETLILFYRQEQSIERVAAATNASPDAVRQRLVRGRQMLREELAQTVERQLAATTPGPQFTQRVVASLPALPALAAHAGAVSATAKGTALAKGAALAKTTGFSLLIAPVASLLGLMFGTVQDARQSQTPRQRRIAIILGIAQFALIAAWAVCYHFLTRMATFAHWPFPVLLSAYAGATSGFAAFFFGIVAAGRWRLDAALLAEHSSEPPFPTLSVSIRLLFAAPVVAVFLGWMVPLATTAGDGLGAGILLALIILQSFWLAWRMPRLQPARTVQQTFETFTLALLSIVALLHWRSHLWFALPALSPSPDALAAFLRTLDFSAFVLFAWITAITLWDRRKRVVIP